MYVHCTCKAKKYVLNDLRGCRNDFSATMKHLSTRILGLFTDHHLKLNIILHTNTHISDHKENKSSSETFDPPRTPCQPIQIFDALRISIRSVLGSGHLIHCLSTQPIHLYPNNEVAMLFRSRQVLYQR